jgi:hypothetical protein
MKALKTICAVLLIIILAFIITCVVYSTIGYIYDTHGKMWGGIVGIAFSACPLLAVVALSLPDAVKAKEKEK